LEWIYGGEYMGSSSPPLIPFQSQVVSFFGFPYQTVNAILFSTCKCYESQKSHRTWLDHPNNIWRQTVSCHAFRMYNLYVCLCMQEFFCTFLTGLSEESHNWTLLRWGQPLGSNRIRPRGSLMLFRLKNLPSIKRGLKLEAGSLCATECNLNQTESVTTREPKFLIYTFLLFRASPDHWGLCNRAETTRLVWHTVVGYLKGNGLMSAARWV
jgi:hypothetical protein